jgi:DNA polymerase-4
MAEAPRAIIHLDLDAFFASVEVCENPELEGKAVIVGGSPSGRGVVTSATYPARALGVRSAIPTFRALALCPGAIVLPPRHRVYYQYSKRVMAILRETSPLMQQMSVDEAFLDVTEQIESWEKAVDLARELQRRVKEEVGLPASLGVATNKLVAKVASDRDKPGGLTVVLPGEEQAFLGPLPVRVLRGVGPVTARKLAELGVETVADLARLPEERLMARFGRQGKAMARQARGIGSRTVVTERRAKSVSQERTFSTDIANEQELERRLRKLSEGVARRLKRSGVAAGTVALKLRYADFTTLTRQMSLSVATDDEEIIHQAALTLLQRVKRRGRPVRLLGVAARHLTPPAGQLPLL